MFPIPKTKMTLTKIKFPCRPLIPHLHKICMALSTESQVTIVITIIIIRLRSLKSPVNQSRR